MFSLLCTQTSLSLAPPVKTLPSCQTHKMEIKKMSNVKVSFPFSQIQSHCGCCSMVKYCLLVCLFSRHLHHLDAVGESEQLRESLHLPALQQKAAQETSGPDVHESS